MIQGALLIALAALLWATTGIVAKFLFTGTELQAITLGFLRLAVALPFFWLLMRRQTRPRTLLTRLLPTWASARA